jgi:hypothetical protein
MMRRTIAVFALSVTLLSGCSSNKSSAGGSPQPSAAASAAATSAQTKPPAADCGGESPVWAIPGPKVFLLPDDRLYGKTKHGTYLCLSQAEALGYRPARHPFRHREHRKKLFSV